MGGGDIGAWTILQGQSDVQAFVFSGEISDLCGHEGRYKVSGSLAGTDVLTQWTCTWLFAYSLKLKELSSPFGNKEKYSFSTCGPISLEENVAEAIRLIQNNFHPAKDASTEQMLNKAKILFYFEGVHFWIFFKSVGAVPFSKSSENMCVTMLDLHLGVFCFFYTYIL